MMVTMHDEVVEINGENGRKNSSLTMVIAPATTAVRR